MNSDLSLNRRQFLITGALLSLTAQMKLMADEMPIDSSVKRVLFLGDSITYAGLYTDYIIAAWRTRYPESKIEFINVGLPSETVSGLSEPGHAGGKFPRPDLHERLDRVLSAVKPHLVTACYGMNDGVYYPFGEDRFEAFQKGMIKLREKVQAIGASIIHLTPPVFDPLPIKGKTLPAGLETYEKPYEGYDDVLAQYAKWLMKQRSNGWVVYDIHTPMAKHLKNRRKKTPDFHYAKDGVHPSPTGHWLMAQALLQGWKLPPDIETIAINAAKRMTTAGHVDNLETYKSGLSFTWNVRLSQPYDNRWDETSIDMEHFDERTGARRLVVTGLATGTYQLKDGNEVLGEFDVKQLAKGIVLNRVAKSTLLQKGNELLKLIGQERKMMCDAWLTSTGHKRPGMAKGLPLDVAQKKAAPILQQIDMLVKPLSVKLELTKTA